MLNSLILGASGQVGQALIPEIEKRGWSWAGSCHEHGEVDSRLFKLNLADIDSVVVAVRERKPNAVFLPSGWTWVDGCEDDPKRAYRVNAEGPEAVARECAKLGSALVFYSTDYVFGLNGGPYDERAATEPLGVYGASKLDGEKRVLAACPDGLVLRTNVVYGAELQGKNFVYQLVRNLRVGKAMTLPKDQLSSPTFNRDLARASVELVELAEKGVWNVAGSEVIDRPTFATLACGVFGLDAGLVRPMLTVEMKQKAARPLAAGLLIEKLVKRLGWKPKGPLEGLQAMKAEMAADPRFEAGLKV